MRYLHLPSDGPADPACVGGKGAGLLDAVRLLERERSLRVPPFAILDLELFREYQGSRTLPEDLDSTLDAAIASLELATGARFGESLVVSVRSSPPVSMPGMLDTVLDVGATRAAIDALEARLGDRVAALDVRRRFLESFGTVVRRIPRARFDEHGSTRVASRASVAPRAPRTPESLEQAIARHEATIRGAGELPDDARAQLRAAIEAVLASWYLERARDYRAAQSIDPELGTAVVIQAMVFGNAVGASGSGVAFTRSPVSGEKHLFGEFLPGAQGDEVVGGRASPAGLSAASSGRRADESLERVAPEAFAELEQIARALEHEYADAQDIELTVERGTLWILQIRSAKRAPRAAFRIAVDLVREGRIGPADALARVHPSLLGAIVSHEIPSTSSAQPLTVGLAASPGAVVGRVAFDPQDARDSAARGEAVILVRSECSPEDAPGIRAAAGVLTSSGGLTSHAAVIARALGKPCVVSASELRIDPRGGGAEVRTAGRGSVPLPSTITVDGATGRVFGQGLELAVSFGIPEARELLEWARDTGVDGPWADAVARYLP